MKKGDAFPVKKSEVGSEEDLRIIEKHIAPFLSKCNEIKINSNGVGPSQIDFKAFERK